MTDEYWYFLKRCLLFMVHYISKFTFQKHHYRELSLEAQYLLGEDSATFTNYWTERFPLLLAHTWITMQCVADEEKFKSYYHKSHRYSVKQFKDQMEQYLTLNPIERRLSHSGTFKISEEIESFKEVKRTRRTKYIPKTDYQNVQETSEKNVLVKSAGLYRNRDSPENRRLTNKANCNKSLPIKKPKKKSDEPLVWVLDTNTNK